MRVILILLWTFSIFVFTCTASFSELLSSGVVRFRWEGHPEFAELMFPMPIQIDEHFLLQKIGHLMAFFLLAMLLQTKLRSPFVVFVLAVTYAVLTEFLQLYFSRDGRLFDMGIDVVGILLSLAVGKLLIAKQAVLAPTQKSIEPKR